LKRCKTVVKIPIAALAETTAPLDKMTNPALFTLHEVGLDRSQFFRFDRRPVMSIKTEKLMLVAPKFQSYRP